MNPELHNALATLLKAVGQQAPHLTAEENITVSSQMIIWLSYHLNETPKFADLIDEIETGHFIDNIDISGWQ